MIAYKAGDVALVEFVFSDESGIKKRPVLVISSFSYQEQRQELIVAAITSNTARAHFGDTLIKEWKQAGLLLPSLSTAILRTVKKSMMAGRLGSLTVLDFAHAAKNIRNSLALN